MSIFNDVVALAKAGWKPSDIKSIMEMDQKKEKKEESVDYKAKFEEAQAKLQKIYDENSRKEVNPDEPNIDYIISDIASKL